MLLHCFCIAFALLLLRSHPALSLTCAHVPHGENAWSQKGLCLCLNSFREKCGIYEDVALIVSLQQLPLAPQTSPAFVSSHAMNPYPFLAPQRQHANHVFPRH